MLFEAAAKVVNVGDQKRKVQKYLAKAHEFLGEDEPVQAEGEHFSLYSIFFSSGDEYSQGYRIQASVCLSPFTVFLLLVFQPKRPLMMHSFDGGVCLQRTINKHILWSEFPLFEWDGDRSPPFCSIC